MVYSFIISTGWAEFFGLIPLVLGVIIISLGIFGKKKNENTAGIKKTAYITVGIGILSIVIGIVLFFVIQSNYTVAVGKGYISVSGLVGGSINVSSSEISSAYVGNIINGNLTLALRTDGTSIGNLNAGLFQLSNGAKAYVASENSTDVIIKLNNGQYLIVGNGDTYSLAAIISKNVHSISGYQ